jgi:hypothetical protein
LKHERATEEVRELSALYALGALTQHEAHSFEIHLRDCPVCKSELSRLEHAAAGIGLAAGEVETPEYLRDLLIARVERETQVYASTPKSDPDEKKNATDIEPPVFASLAHDSKPKPRKIIPFIATIILASSIFSLWNSSRRMAQENNRLQTQLSASKMAIDDLKKKLDTQKNQPAGFAQILEVAGRTGMRTAWLAGQSSATSASGTFFWDTQQHRYLFMGSFPPAPQGKQYQLWLVTPTNKVSAGLLKANPDGTAYIAAPIPEDSSEATAAGITLEPENGSPIPTTRFYALGRFN